LAMQASGLAPPLRSAGVKRRKDRTFWSVSLASIQAKPVHSKSCSHREGRLLVEVVERPAAACRRLSWLGLLE